MHRAEPEPLRPISGDSPGHNVDLFVNHDYVALQSRRAIKMLSSRAKYALRACVYLAEQDHLEQWSLTSDIAAAEDIPHKFLEAILVELRDHNIVQSRRGRYGGHRLARPPDEIAAGELIRIVDGPLALAPCASKTQFGQCADCLDLRSCALRSMLRKARDAVAGVLDGYSLAMLAGVGKKRGDKAA